MDAAELAESLKTVEEAVVVRLLVLSLCYVSNLPLHQSIRRREKKRYTRGRKTKVRAYEELVEEGEVKEDNEKDTATAAAQLIVVRI